MNTKKIKTLVKTPGDKWHLKDFVISNFPDNYEQMTYVEPFCAGATIYLNKNPSSSEIISDIDDGFIAMFKAIRDEPKEFFTRIKRTTYTERAFKMAFNKSHQEFEDYIDKAVNEYILRKMSRGGLKKTFLMSDKLSEESEDESAWQETSDKIDEISQRLKNTTILCKNYIQILKFWDEADTLFYLDPPELRPVEGVVMPNEFSVEDHMNLIQLAKNSKAKIIISGVSCPLYNRSFKNWKCKKKPTNAKGKVECLWVNY